MTFLEIILSIFFGVVSVYSFVTGTPTPNTGYDGTKRADDEEWRQMYVPSYPTREPQSFAPYVYTPGTPGL